jgi:hypothetical protein
MKPVKPFHGLIALIILVSGIFIQESIRNPAFGQTYPLPPPSSKDSVADYPEKVKESLKNVIGISANFSLRSSRNRFLEEGSRAGGTGFMIYPGVFVSAGHVLTANLDKFIISNFIMTFDKYGVPSSDFFNYSISGVTDVGNQSRDITMSLVGLGTSNKFQDYMILKSTDYPTELKSLAVDTRIMSTDEVVYNAGYVLSYMIIDPRTNSPVLYDILRKSFAGRIDSVITNFPINEVTGIPELYRIEIKLEQGFSGGPVFNSEGKVIALTILRSNNFSYAIPIKNIDLLVDRLARDKVISKK